MDMFVREDRVVIMMKYELKWRAVICEIGCQKVYGFSIQMFPKEKIA